jgi:type IV pilus assembly protein PilQ
VYTKEEYEKIKEDKSRMIYKVFTLYYISAAEAEKLIKPVLSDAGVMQSSTAAVAGISTSDKGITGGEAGGDSMALHDTIVVYDFPENVAKAGEVIKSVDIRPKQVLIEATILSATLTEGMTLGVDLNLQAGVSLTGVAAQEGVQNSSSGGYITDPVAAQTVMEQVYTGTAAGTPIETSGLATFGGTGLRVGIRTGDVVAFISALESVTEVTVLANPKILALNKQVGTVFIGTKLGYRSQTTQIDTSTTQKVVFLDTGTKLSFRPYIGDDGYIRMDIYPKDSSGELDSEGIPTETTAELTTNIMVKDGQTVVIGGLFRDDVRTIRSQIPFLGDLPIIGAAFRKTTDSSVRQEIIVMLTCHIIEEPSETEGEARAADIQRKRFGAKESLQWVGRTRLAEDRYATAAKYYLDGNSKAAMRELNVVLTLRPTYLEAIRLKERIISEKGPKAVRKKIERKVIDIVEQEDVEKWLRR